MAGDVKTKVSIEGAAEYRKQLTNITKQAKALSSEMKAATSAFTENTTAEEKNRTTSQLLTKQIEIQKQKVALIEEQWKKTTAAMGENSDAALDLKNDLNKANAELNKMQHGLDDAGEGATKFGLNFQNMAQVVAASAVFKAVVDGVKQVVNAFAEYEQVSSGVEALFGEEAAAIIEANAFKAYKTAGVSANKYMEQVTNFSAALLKSVEGDTVRAAFIADQAIRDMADNANRFGTDLSTIQTAYAGFAKQQFTLLDNLKLGYAGTKEGMEQLLAKAEELTGKEFDISNLADIYEAIHAIQESMGVTGTTADEAETTISGSVAGMQAAWQNFLTSLGTDTIDSAEAAKQWGESFTLVVQNIGTVVREIVPAIAAALPSLVEAGVQMVVAIARGIVLGALEVFKALIILTIEVENWLVQEGVPKFIEGGKQLVQGLLSGLKGDWSGLTSWFNNAISGLISGVKRLLGIRSPSRVFAEIGGYMAEGLGAGWESSFAAVSKDINKGLNFGAPSVAVAAAPGGVTVGSIVLNGYSASDGNSLVKDINRALGRLYV